MTRAPDRVTGSNERLWVLLREAVKHLPNEVRYRAENSFIGFQRARLLLPLDREMASFRAITAEEEAAAALFRSLQLRGYPGAERLSLKLHQHKAAVGFFLAAVRQALVGEHEIKLQVTLQSNPPVLTVALPVSQFIGDDEAVAGLHIALAEPLGLTGAKDGIAEADFFNEAVAKVAGDRNVDKLISKQANSRNHILYAHDSGLPESRVTAQGIDRRERTAEVLILLALAILQVQTHQAFAVQCLGGFLKIIGRARADVFT